MTYSHELGPEPLYPHRSPSVSSPALGHKPRSSGGSTTSITTPGGVGSGSGIAGEATRAVAAADQTDATLGGASDTGGRVRAAASPDAAGRPHSVLSPVLTPWDRVVLAVAFVVVFGGMAVWCWLLAAST